MKNEWHSPGPAAQPKPAWLGGLGSPGTAKAVEACVSLMFSSFRSQNGVGRRLGLWLPWLAGWPTPAQDRESNEMQKWKMRIIKNELHLRGLRDRPTPGLEPPKVTKRRK